MKKWLVVAIAFMGFGCATTYPVAWKTLPEFNTPYDNAWNIVMDVITEKNIQLDIIQKDAGYIKSTNMSWNGKNFVLVVKFTNKSPVNLKLQVMGTVYNKWTGQGLQTGIPDLEKLLLDEIEGRLRITK